jgi:hypothetical protein
MNGIFDEWTKRLCYTWLLIYQLNEFFFEMRQNCHILNEFNDFMIPLPVGDGKFTHVEIVYTPSPHDMFQSKTSQKWFSNNTNDKLLLL